MGGNENSILEQVSENAISQEDREFEAIADLLAEEFTMYVGDNRPFLSDYAVSRGGIYEEYP